MTSHTGWIFALALGLGAVVTTALANQPEVHLAVAAVIAAIFAVRGILVHRAETARGASRSAVASSNAASMGLVWLWGGIAIVIIYTGILTWREWWQFALAFLIAGGISMGFSRMLARDANAGRDDETMLKLARSFAWLQLAGMVATMAGLLIDPDKRFVVIRERWEDWAANSIFFFGAAALAVLSAYALKMEKR
jgi:hypothetical protein